MKQTSLRKFADVLTLLSQERKRMSEENPLFKTLRDNKLPIEQRMLFVPYMLFFSCGCPDVMTMIMRVNKQSSDLTFVENKINEFITEDNFHYNYYLRDLIQLGYGLNNFGDIAGVIRHVFATESSDVRMLIYNLAYYLKASKHPIITLAIVEVLEAGLFDLFTTVYVNIVKVDNGFGKLEYYGDTHVLLEKNHKVTSWFGMREDILASVANIDIPEAIESELFDMILELMGSFNHMYLAFDNIIKNNIKLKSDKFNVTGVPPIDHIAENWNNVDVSVS